MYFDVVSNQWVSGAEYGNLGEVTIWGKKGSAGTIDKGCPVYIVGFDDDIHEVELANATTASTMLRSLACCSAVLTSANVSFGKQEPP